MRFLNDDKPFQQQNYIDLHLHSCFSDGKLSPEEIVQIAKDKNVQVISITDHDTAKATERAITSGNALGVQVIPGIEMGVNYKNTEFHLLGYFFDYKSPLITEYEKMMRHSRVERAKKIIAELDKIGFHITYDLVEQKADGAPIGRPHIAQALVEQGYVYSIFDAFQHYLGEDKKANVQKNGVNVREAMDIIKSSGGITVLAHPVTISYLQELLPILLDAGLDGIETIHPKHSLADVAKLKEIANKYNLLQSGGSDCHGSDAGTALLGSLDIPYSFYEKMQKKREQLLKTFV